MEEQKSQEKQSANEPHVKIFGEEVTAPKKGKENCCDDPNCCGRRRYRSEGDMVWGLVVLLGGVILLLNNIGTIPWQFWNFVWPFWPMLLILVGIRILLGRDWISNIIIFLLALLLFGYVIIYALIQVNSSLLVYFPSEIINFVKVFNPFN